MKKTIFSALFVTLFGLYAIVERITSVNSIAETNAFATPITLVQNAPEPVPTKIAVAKTEDEVHVQQTPKPAAQPKKVARAQPSPIPPNAAVPPIPVNTPVVQPPPVPVHQIFKDGTFTGVSADAYYGYIQVQITTKDDRITDVVFLDHPSDRRESQRINARAMPILASEAIAAQNAHVDMVSGATDSSGAFIESLSSAISQAHV